MLLLCYLDDGVGKCPSEGVVVLHNTMQFV